jgi:hypothetical protein
MGFENVVPMNSVLHDGGTEIRLTSGRHRPPEVLAEMGEVAGFLFRAEGEPVLYWRMRPHTGQLALVAVEAR